MTHHSEEESAETSEPVGCPIDTDDLSAWPDRPKGSPPIRRRGIEYPDEPSK